jgi:hypothetical protein
LLHADAAKAEHQCAVTLFAHGQVDSASVTVPVPAPPPAVQTVASVLVSAFCPIIEQLPAGRAPPALPSVS